MDWRTLSPHRHCERSESIQNPPRQQTGLLRCARNDGARCSIAILQVPLSFPAKAEKPVRRSLSIQSRPPLEYWIVRSSRTMTASVWLQTHLRILAARFARALLRFSTLRSKRAQGRPGAGWHPRSAARRCSAKEPHSSIQVVPITRPSLRSGWTAYAVLSREPSSCWPPSLPQKSPTPRRLTRMPPPQELGCSKRRPGPHGFAVRTARHFAAVFPAPSTEPETYRRDEPDSAARRHDALGLTESNSPCPWPLAPDAAASTATRLATVTTHDRPSRMSRDGRHLRHFRTSVK
jgi:hypothetical protein